MIKPSLSAMPKRLKWPFKKTSAHPIVPRNNVVGTALIIVIAIMTFLSSLAVGGVNLVSQSAKDWQGQLTREASVQIRPMAEQNMAEELDKAVALLKTFPGIGGVEIVDESATKRLLEPWLGQNLNLDVLPIPRLIVVKFDKATPANLDEIATAVRTQIRGGSFENHNSWASRLSKMADSSIIFGIFICGLNLLALTLTIIFATKSALSANAHIVEVLHFIGADARFVARQFDLYFLATGFKGAIYGGLSAILLFGLCALWSKTNQATPQSDQAQALFGSFVIGGQTYAQIILLIVAIAVLTMLTNRLTILRQLNRIDQRERDLF